MEGKMKLGWSVLAKILGEPVEQVQCSHPEIARDFRLNLLPEEEGWEGYEVCLNCGKEWHDA
jgi:hypothetical protein